jgi:hypothetical protein
MKLMIVLLVGCKCGSRCNRESNKQCTIWCNILTISWRWAELRWTSMNLWMQKNPWKRFERYQGRQRHEQRGRHHFKRLDWGETEIGRLNEVCLGDNTDWRQNYMEVTAPMFAILHWRSLPCMFHCQWEFQRIVDLEALNPREHCVFKGSWWPRKGNPVGGRWYLYWWLRY